MTGSNTQKTIFFVTSALVSIFLAILIVRQLALLETTVRPEIYLTRIALLLFAFSLPILGGWIALRIGGSILFASFASVMVFFTEALASSTVFVWFLLQYGALCFVLYRLEQYFEDQIAISSVDLEKYQAERNDLEISYKSKGEGISVLFEKYSTYYNLRKLAEELATSLSIDSIAKILVEKSVEFIGRGDIAIIALADEQEKNLKTLASKATSKSASVDREKSSSNDPFDAWGIKNQRRLIVTDTYQDFRFDIKEAAKNKFLRSLILAPIHHHGRVIGTLRMDASQTEGFSNDDLRLLDTIAVLGSSALSNAMLFEQTEQLAIRDSLTGLYVRRYFFDRLKEEHRRSLMTKRALSVLMCDLDHFKDVNDKYGHGVGDLMLVHFTRVLKACVESGVVGRYGGEEFIVLLPETSKDKAINIAERIRAKVEQEPFQIRREKITMTVSIGVASVPTDVLDREELIQKADEALYNAKKAGRNRVCPSKG